MEAGSIREMFSKYHVLQIQCEIHATYISDFFVSLFVNFEVRNTNSVCRFWSLQVIKIMQMEMLNVAVLMPLRRQLVMIAM
jgi:hypothetical protein